MDGLSWPYVVTFELLGTRFAFRSQHEGAVETVVDLFAPHEEPVRVGPSRTFSLRVMDDGALRLYEDCTMLTEHPTFPPSLPHLLGAVNRIALARETRLAIHAGVVASTSATIALPGISGAGKSTLTLALVLDGWTYVSDEALIVEPTGRVIPYPRPLALDTHGLELLGARAPASIDGGIERIVALSPSAPPQAPVTHVLLLDRTEDRPGIEPIPGSEVAAELLRLSFNHYRDPLGAVRTASTIAATAQGFRLRYAHPDEAVDLVRSVVERPGG